jgi:hypothetical protein
MANDKQVPTNKGNDPDAFRASLDAVDDENGYLGDTQYIASMLRMLVAECMAAASERKAETIRKLAEQAALVLLGKAGDAKPITGWNEPGGIDEFAAEWTGIKADTAQERMTLAVLQLISEVLDVVNYASQPGVKSDDWKFQFDALIQKYTLIFIGISPATAAAIL